jgi:uncharacterized damage-inducible protein DinB
LVQKGELAKIMLETLRDLYRHQEWADAEHWTAIESCPPALSDEELHDRLTHLHIVQRGFLKVFKSEPINIKEELGRKPPLADLKAIAQNYHKDVIPFLAALADERLDEKVVVPWFPGEFSLPLREAALQAVLHSLYHRGQNATRLKQLGTKPPLTDYIVWVFKGRPVPVWPD